MEAQTKDTYSDFLKKVMSEPSLKEYVEIGQLNKEKVKKEKGVPGRHNRDLETRDPNQDDLAGHEVLIGSGERQVGREDPPGY